MKISHTAPFAVTALAVSLFAVSGCEEAENGTATVDQSVEAAHDHDGEDHDHAMDETGAAGKSLMDNAGDTMDGMKAAGEDAMNDATAKGKELMAEGEATLEKAGDAMGQATDGVKAEATKMLDQVKELIDEDELDQAQEMLDKVKNMKGVDQFPAVQSMTEDVQGMLDSARG